MSTATYKLYDNSKQSFDILRKQIDYNQPLMYDCETRKHPTNRLGLYGKIRLAQFYQEGWDHVILIEDPEPFNLIMILDAAHVVGHSLTYDISTIHGNTNYTKWQPKRIDDTLYLSRLFYYSRPSFTLNSCLSYAIGHCPYEAENLDKQALQKSNWDSPVLNPDQLLYAACDVFYLPQLWNEVQHMRSDVSYKIDITNLSNSLDFQCNGMPVLPSVIAKKYAANEARIKEIALPVNANSYKQVREYISSMFSDDEGLTRLALEGNERAGAVKETRKLLKQNNFLGKYATDDCLVRGKFSPGARSGRSTCNNENLQNIPRGLKDCFGVEEDSDTVMVYSDFSQLELRCAAAVVNDLQMVKVYKQGVDIHNYTAQQIYKTDKPTKDERFIAKTCNFSLLYGSGAPVLIAMLQKQGKTISLPEAEKIKRDWLKVWLQIAQWQKRGSADYRAKKPGSTPLGRRYIAKQYTDQLNIQIQGAGSEVAKLANHYIVKECIRLAETNESFADWKDWQRNFVHDSFLFVIPNSFKLYEKFSIVVATAMQEAWQQVTKACKVTDLPMPTKVLVGTNWGDIENEQNIIYEHNQ